VFMQHNWLVLVRRDMPVCAQHKMLAMVRAGTRSGLLCLHQMKNWLSLLPFSNPFRRADDVKGPEANSSPQVRTNRPHNGCRAFPQNKQDVRVRSATHLELLSQSHLQPAFALRDPESTNPLSTLETVPDSWTLSPPPVQNDRSNGDLLPQGEQGCSVEASSKMIRRLYASLATARCVRPVSKRVAGNLTLGFLSASRSSVPNGKFEATTGPRNIPEHELRSSAAPTRSRTATRAVPR
jgi:hypothetical protein